MMASRSETIKWVLFWAILGAYLAITFFALMQVR